MLSRRSVATEGLGSNVSGRSNDADRVLDLDDSPVAGSSEVADFCPSEFDLDRWIAGVAEPSTTEFCLLSLGGVIVFSAAGYNIVCARSICGSLFRRFRRTGGGSDSAPD